MFHRLALLSLLALTAAVPTAAGQQAPVNFLELPEAPAPVGLTGFATSNASCLAQVTNVEMSSSSGNDCWGYVSPSGREYAIMCTVEGTAWVEVTDPFNPVVLVFYDGPNSTWRDPKVFEDHAYVVSEGGQGIQVFDMSQIDTGLVTYLGDVTVGGATNSHNVVIDEASGFLYRVGTGSGMLIYDLNQDKANPPYVGSWNGAYLHDAQAHTYTSGPAAGTEVVFGLAGSSSQALWVLDVTNKGAVSVLSQATYPSVGYSHQGWLSTDERYFYTNDEFDESAQNIDTTTYVFDVLDPANAAYVGKFDNGNPAIGHNGYVQGDLLYEANYTSGLRVFDLAASPTNPPEVAWVDTYPADDSKSYSGMWSCYPYFPSGVVLGSDRSEGLLILFVGAELVSIAPAATPSLVAPSGAAIAVTVTEASPGDLVPGTEQLHYNDGGGWQSAPLASLGGSAYQAQFPALACGAELSYYYSAQSTNGFTWQQPFGGQNAPYTALVASGETLVFQDDFQTDTGWTVSNLGATDGDWGRGVPVNDPNWAFDPSADSDGSGSCYLTDNSLGNSDVDGGGVRLQSPDLDLSGGSPVVQYDYFLNLTDTSGADYIAVTARDMLGAPTWFEVARHDTNGGDSWRTARLTAADFAAAGVTLSTQVRLRFEAFDTGLSTIVEAGLDAFSVRELDCGPQIYCTAGSSGSGCQAALSASGTPSVSAGSGFSVDATNVEGNAFGIYFYGWNGRQANPWGNGSSYQCVVPPVKRTPVLPKVGTSGSCDGSFSLDLNAFVAANPNKTPPAGLPVQLQLWYRDPTSTSNQNTSLSEGLEFSMAP